LSDPYTSIQFAIDQVSTLSGDTLEIAAGLYVENIQLGGKELTIDGRDGPEATIVQSGAPGPVVLVNTQGGVVLEGLTITGATGAAAGVHLPAESQPTLQIHRCIVRDNEGPGIYSVGSVWVFRSTLVANERALEARGGAAVMANSIEWGNDLPILTESTFAMFRWMLHQGIFGCGLCPDGDDPGFWDFAARDLKLRPGSPGIGAGVPYNPLDPPAPGGSPIDIGALPFDPTHAPPTSTYCPGTDTNCPCENGGAPGAGCDIAQGTGGVSIAVQNYAPDGVGGGTAVVIGTGYPAMSFPRVTLIRSPGVQDPPIVFGDGLQCIGSAGLIRVRAAIAQGGGVSVPVMHGAGAGTFFYQLWNRNTPIMFCDPTAAFNLSNALEIVWP
jgi:hypothetical protein